MPDFRKAFPSKYLSSADLDGREPVVTIDRVVSENIGDDLKLVVYFAGKDKGVVLNKTNANAIADITGEDDTDAWKGHKIKLITVKVEFQGKRVPAIRIEEAAPKSTRKAAPPVREAGDEEDNTPLKDEVGF